MQHGTQSKIYRDGKGRVLKDMRGGNLSVVRKEYEMQGSVYRKVQQVPRPIILQDAFIVMEDLGMTEKITDLDFCLKAAEPLLDGLLAGGVRHNDLQPGNIIIKGNVPYAVDFGWARWESDPPLDMPSDRISLLHALRMLYEQGPDAKRSWSWKKV